MSPHPLTVMLVAAEASGDDRGAGLMAALKGRLPDDVRFVGVGGERMAAEGLVSPFDIAELSILGLVEGLLAYPRAARRAGEVAATVAREKPDVVILIDSWGFTLLVARRLRRLDPSPILIKYVAPQVWASRPGRARTAAKVYDHLLSIHAFEAAFFEEVGLAVTFVGDATLTLDFTKADPARLMKQIGAGPEEPILLVLPGSRPSEIERVLPAFEDAVHQLKMDRPDLHVVVAAAPMVSEVVKAKVDGWSSPATVIEGAQVKLDAMKAATVALACSGTVTTELAMAGCPMVVGYRLGGLSYAILKRLVRIRYITLINIAAENAVAPELIQHDCNGASLAREVARRLDDPQMRRAQVRRQDAALAKMGRVRGDDPHEAAAGAILKLAGRTPPLRA